MKKLKPFLFISLIFLSYKFCDWKTGGFTVATIDTHIPYSERWETPPLPSDEEENIHKILSQPFRFLAQGGQSYVFLSQDQKTVLKFFKLNHGLSDALVKQLPWRFKYLETREERFRSIFKSCKLAYEALKNETGLLYLHLNPTQGKYPPLQIIDNLGISHTIDLDTTSFLLQKKADLAIAKIRSQIAKRDIEGAKKSIHALLCHFHTLCKKGIRDTDNALRRNYGYVEDQAICVDVGSLISDDIIDTKKEILHKTRRLHRYLRKEYPSLLSFYNSEIDGITRGNYGS